MEQLNITTEILTLEEARRRVALIRSDVKELMGLSKQIRELHPRVSALDPESPAAMQLTDELDELHERWRRRLKAINDQGGYVKDPMTGLLDFYSWMDGELVFLCWQHGEETITTWHGLHEGFTGRRPVRGLEDF